MVTGELILGLNGNSFSLSSVLVCIGGKHVCLEYFRLPENYVVHGN